MQQAVVKRSREELQSLTRFDPGEVEPRITERWLASGMFHPEPAGTPDENYSIAIPPPNVTGALHMGHALNGAIQDALVRYHRMRGRRTKWIFGTDHAGIATQTQVERALAEQGISREQLGRAAFIERVWEWRAQYGSQIVNQYKRLGASCDYEDERFTLDPDYERAVGFVFKALFDKGYIYRDNYIVNWDPGSHSAISDLEVEEREVHDELYSIAYPLASGEGEIVVATVRPETMLGDVAVAVHPDDDRYRHLVGQEAILPLVGRRLPIVADDYVKPDFGSGALKITPGHDPNDFEIGRRHGFPPINVIGEDGRMTAEAGERFAGLTVAEARREVIAALQREGAIRKVEPYVHEVPFSHRSGERIEPLVSLQWFMRMDELAKPAIEVVRDGRVRITPEGQRRRYLEWMENIRPWVISRQLWWGHQLPVYYCDACDETYVALEDPGRCAVCGGPTRRDPDVLDTWFSSALWPFATLGWPDATPQLRAFYPTDVNVTARDIIFLWVARMIMMGLEFTEQVPFTDVYVHSVIQAPDGRRMSKSLGTGIDPLEEIDLRGADALRFGLLAMSSTQDVKYSEEKIKQGQALANKLFNAARFVLLGVDAGAEPAPQPRTVEDRWILSRLQRVKADTAARLEAYDFSHAALGLYDFIYGELCDWYIELVKAPLAGGDERQRAALSSTLLHALAETLALAHPVIPFVTEELWGFIADDLLAGHAYPRPDESLIDPDAEAAIARLIAATQALRGWRETVEIGSKTRVHAVLEADGYDDIAAAIARLSGFEFVDAIAGGSPIATIPIPGGRVAVLPADLDLSAYEQRRARERAQLEQDIARIEGKLANDAFVKNAPDAIVSGEREKLAALKLRLESLTDPPTTPN
jgi:valyl-tRNA synthetase